MLGLPLRQHLLSQPGIFLFNAASQAPGQGPLCGEGAGSARALSPLAYRWGRQSGSPGSFYWHPESTEESQLDLDSVTMC